MFLDVAQFIPILDVKKRKYWKVLPLLVLSGSRLTTRSLDVDQRSNHVCHLHPLPSSYHFHQHHIIYDIFQLATAVYC